MIFKRKPMQHVLPLLLGALLGYLSYNSIMDARAEGLTGLLIYGIVMGLWGAFVLFHYLRNPNLGELRDDGLTLRRPLGAVSFTWDQLQWAKTSDDGYALVFAYRRPGESKDRYTGVGRKTIGPEAVAAIRAAIATARPGLPASLPEKQERDGAAA